MSEATKEEVRAFLREFKRLAGQTQIVLAGTEKTDSALLQLELTRTNCRQEIMELSVLDYCSGPQPDHNRPGEIWVFSKRIKGQEVYIKLKIVRGRTHDQPLCISFHVAERPTEHPFKPWRPPLTEAQK